MYHSQTPIDIHCSKLVDWLVQRNHCKKDWGQNLAAIRKKMKLALGDMPENEEIKQLLIGSKLEYFKSKRIVEILRTTEADTKNFFGYYSSQRMKDWQDIVKSYERNCIYLAETATDLIRETNYEVPGIKRMLNKLKQEKEDLMKEKTNLLRRAQQFASEHQRLAQSYGISGNNVGQELFERSRSLMSIMDQIVQYSCDLKSGLDYYRDYSALNSNKSSDDRLVTLNYLIIHGNTTVYEWKYGEPPQKVEVIEKSWSNLDDVILSEEIDLDIDDEIDFGDDPASSESSSGFVHVNKTPTGNGTSSEGSYIKIDDPVQIESTTGNKEKIARGDDAKLVLEYRQSRNQFLNNLYELDAFLNQTFVNLEDTDERSSSLMMGDMATVSNRLDGQQIKTLLHKIRSVLEIFNIETNRILFQMNDSPLFVENIKDKLYSKMRQSNECKSKAESLVDQIEEIDKQIRDTEVHLKKCISLTKEVQDKIQTSLRELYNGRPINIMGCVN